MPFHRVKRYSREEKWADMGTLCTCMTGDRCECSPAGYWAEEWIPETLLDWFDHTELLGWVPTCSRGYPVPDKVPTDSVVQCPLLPRNGRACSVARRLLPSTVARAQSDSHQVQGAVCTRRPVV